MLRRSIKRTAVAFASASSQEVTPRIAIAEAFDLALGALGKNTPNFAYLTVAAGGEDYLDAPGRVWQIMSNQATDAGLTPCLSGCAVRKQTVGDNGTVSVLLGHIPDLQVFPYDLDNKPNVPSPADKSGEATNDDTPTGVPRLALHLVHMDGMLTVNHRTLVASRLQSIAQEYTAPMVGAVIPPVEEQTSESVAFVNDKVVRGGCTGMLLASDELRCRTATVSPGVIASPLAADGTPQLSKITKSRQLLGEPGDPANGDVIIEEIDGMPATERIRKLFDTSEILKERKDGKLFLAAVAPGGKHLVPFPFTGDVETGAVCVNVGEALLRGTPELSFSTGTEIHFVTDDPDTDTVEAAKEMFLAEKRFFGDITPGEDMLFNTGGGMRRSMRRSTAGVLHFSTHAMEMQMEGVDASSSFMQSRTYPAIPERCLGRICGTNGLYAPGQVGPAWSAFDADGATVANPPLPILHNRSSVYCFMRGSSEDSAPSGGAGRA